MIFISQLSLISHHFSRCKMFISRFNRNATNQRYQQLDLSRNFFVAPTWGVYREEDVRLPIGHMRRFGGYIEDAQLTLYGIEIYSELNGADAAIPHSFVVPANDDRWPHILWNYDLGQGFAKHMKSLGNTQGRTR